MLAGRPKAQLPVTPRLNKRNKTKKEIRKNNHGYDLLQIKSFEACGKLVFVIEMFSFKTNVT